MHDFLTKTRFSGNPLSILNQFLDEEKTKELVSSTDNWKFAGSSGSLFGVILTTLGFLVAGYAIFCTVLPLELQKQMMDAIDKETNLTYIKKFHFLFLRVFFYFVVFSGILFVINFFQGSSGLIFKLTSKDCVFFSINFIGYCFIISFTIFLLTELMSFIFNIFESVRSALNWEKIIDDKIDDKIDDSK